MAKTIITSAANGTEVYVITNDGHMIAHKDVDKSHIKEAVEQLKNIPNFAFHTVDLGRGIGATNCVETTNADDIRMVCRPGRNLPSRMVYGREPEETSKITVGICKDSDDGLMTIFTAFYGELAPKELSDPSLTERERQEAEAFWATHALIAQ